MPIQTIQELDLAGKRVFLRADLDVPLTPAGGVADPQRIHDALPTIRYILEQGCRLVVGAQLGRPGGRPNPGLSLEPVAAFLAENLRREVFFTDEAVGDGARKVVADLREGSLALLENLAFSQGEVANEERFARALAGYADVYVNDAFASCDQPHASSSGMVRHVALRGIGVQLEQEIKALTPFLGTMPRPFVAVIGGTQVSAKLALLDHLLPRLDAIFAGGAVANTLLRAKGLNLGRSLLEDDKLATVRLFLKKADDRGVRVQLPVDFVAAAGTRAAAGRVVSSRSMPEDLAALDIGPETARNFAEDLSRARTILWNGPLGAHETEAFAGGTREVATAIGRTVTATTLAVGADTELAARRMGLLDRIGHVSRGGAAALSFLEGKKLPGLVAVES